MKRMKVLVCGASGFIGRNIIEALAKRPELEVHGTFFSSAEPMVPGATMHRVDLRDPIKVEKAVSGFDLMIQAAATTSGSKDIVTRPSIHVTDNAVMNSLLFRAAHEAGVGQVVFFSCTVMYHSSETPLKEADYDENRPLHPSYFGVGWTKVYLEKMCEFYSRLGKTRFTAIRHSNIYGPHDKFDLERSHVFGATMTKVLTAKDGRIVVWGTGEESRDLLYVSDLVDLVEAVMVRQTDPFVLVNAGAGKAIAIRDLVARVVSASGRPLKVEHDLSKPTIKTSLALDCGLARRLFGWEPKVSLTEGIRRTTEWYRANPQATA